MNAREAAPWLLLGVVVLGVVVWTWTWPDHPLIPDEAFAKAMTDHVATNGTPFAPEPIQDYRNGAFAVDRYGASYLDHRIQRPATSVGEAYEQGLVGPKAGRAFTLALGTLAIAYLGLRVAGPWGGAFAGVLYATHPATLYFHQSYFSNSGGVAYFLASVALLVAARGRPWLARASVLVGGIAVVFRAEYGAAFAVLALVAWILLDDAASLVAYYSTLALVLLVLWNASVLLPGLTNQQLFKHDLPLVGVFTNPGALVEILLGPYNPAVPPNWGTFAQNARDYFPYFFPLASGLALVGLFLPARDKRATWAYVPLAAQALVQGVTTLPSMDGFDFSNASWLESSIVRYFLPAYALTTLLAGVALAGLVERLPARVGRVRALPLAAVGVAFLVASANVAGAWEAEHGVAWANERRAWFDAIDAAAAGFGPNAVFFGLTPAKVIVSRPVMDPANVGWDAQYTTFVALDLLAKGHRVFALEPWYWYDGGHDFETLLLSSGHAYWTDTGVQVNCACGEFARFYELHPTNATLGNVVRFAPGLRDAPEGLALANSALFAYPERSFHVRTGLGNPRPVVVDLHVLDRANGTYEAGYWNLPLDDPRNAHPLAAWTSNGTGAARFMSFQVPAGEIVNGAYYVRGPDGLVVTSMGVGEG